MIYAGGLSDTTDTIFANQTLKSATLSQHLSFPSGSGAGGLIQIIGRATDGAGNFAEDTLFIFLVNLNALNVVLVSPAPGALASQGKYVPIEVVANQSSRVQRDGWKITPPTGQTAGSA